MKAEASLSGSALLCQGHHPEPKMLNPNTLRTMRVVRLREPHLWESVVIVAVFSRMINMSGYTVPRSIGGISTVAPSKSYKLIW